MSGLEAFGIACNILQVISFARETVDLCKAVYQGAAPGDGLSQSASSMRAVSADLKRHFATRGPKPEARADANLFRVIERCNDAASELEEQTAYISGQQNKGQIWGSVVVVAKTFKRRRRLEKTERRLNDCARVMETGLLAHLCKQGDAIELQQVEGFSQLSESLRQFIESYASGKTRLEDLVSTENKTTRQEVARTILKSEHAVKERVAERAAAVEISVNQHTTRQTEDAVDRVTKDLNMRDTLAASEAQCERLLQSLKFPTMNERVNSVADAYEGTFKWVIKHNDHCDENEAETSSRGSLVASWDCFSCWLESCNDMYWISGKAGSGKSTLVKYLISSSKTRKALSKWNPLPEKNPPSERNPLSKRDPENMILSYFFWKPGTKMQHSVQGLLCTLLHQLLSSDLEVVKKLLSQAMNLSKKDSFSDWSIQELTSLFSQAASCSITPGSTKSFCLFIDGLDEMTDEGGAPELMKVLNEIQAITNVKICVASRPEPRFEKRLQNFQHLKLQELTARDMRKYAEQKLTIAWQESGYSDDVQDIIIEELAVKAEGVFLWLYLAISSLKRGLENGDSETELFRRLEVLPNDLSRLYADMWSRLNDDKEIYRQSAALYFRILIHVQEWDLGDEEAHIRPLMPSGLSLFGLTTVTNKVVQDQLLDVTREATDEATLERLCTKTHQEIQARCAGLLHVTFDNDTSRDYPRLRKNYTALSRPINSQVNFIHRTAYDFLADTEEGQRIQQYDACTADELSLQVVRAYLAERRIADFGWYDSVLPPTSVLANIGMHDLSGQAWKLHCVCHDLLDHGFLYCPSHSGLISRLLDFHPIPEYPSVKDKRYRGIQTFSCGYPLLSSDKCVTQV